MLRVTLYKLCADNEYGTDMLPPLVAKFESLIRKWLGKRVFRPRLSTRLTIEEPVRLINMTGQAQPAILQDVSAGGACLRTHQRLHTGQRIALAMNFGLNQRYELPARVAYVRASAQGSQTRYGVSFVWISVEERRRLDAFVTERANARKTGIRTLAFGSAR